jgi:hypothetical protein
MQNDLKVPLLVVALVAMGLVMVWAWPRSCPLSVCHDYIGYYRGLGLQNGPGLLGKSFYRVVLYPSSPEHRTDVAFTGRGWNRFRGTYPDGTLREEGECWVDINGGAEDPLPDLHNVKWGRYYDPRGKLLSQIDDGTGVQIYCTPTGIKTWELELKNYERARLSCWHKNGQLGFEQSYLHNTTHGPYRSYHASGKLRSEGVYTNGLRTGTWIEYDEDGKKKVTRYDASGKEMSPEPRRSEELPRTKP